MLSTKQPKYAISKASKLLNVHPRTLRIYEAEDLIKPARQKGNRLYSDSDIRWLKCIRLMIHKERLSITGIKKLLKFQPCWGILNCSEKHRSTCWRYQNYEFHCWEIDMCERKKEICNHCETYLQNK